MDRQKFSEFMNEFSELQEKYGIHVSAGYEYEIDYGWDEESYISGVQIYLVYTDSEGNEFNENEFY